MAKFIEKNPKPAEITKAAVPESPVGTPGVPMLSPELLKLQVAAPCVLASPALLHRATERSDAATLPTHVRVAGTTDRGPRACKYCTPINIMHV